MANRKTADTIPSLEELLDGIHNSAMSYPLVFVEGIDDVVIFREIAMRSGITDAAIEQRGGRKEIIKMYEAIRSASFDIKREILFFADKDTYVFSDPPSAYADIHFTNGYAIENDLFEDGIKQLQHDMRPKEWESFLKALTEVAVWFAFEAEQLDLARIETPHKNSDFKDINISRKIDLENLVIDADFLAERGYRKASESYHDLAFNAPVTHIRGKYLFQVYLLILNQRESTIGIKIQPNPKLLWNSCIGAGLQIDSSHCRRISNILHEAHTK